MKQFKLNKNVRITGKRIKDMLVVRYFVELVSMVTTTTSAILHWHASVLYLIRHLLAYSFRL